MFLQEGCATPDSVLGADCLLKSQHDDKSSDCNHVRSHTAALMSEQLHNIFEREDSKHYEVSPNYLHSCILIPLGSKQQGVSERCRRRTCEWMYDICDYFQLSRDVVAIALFYVDRFFTITFASSYGQVPVSRNQFQLVSLTSLYVAIKTHGESRFEESSTRQTWNRGRFNLDICASISRHQFTSEMVQECEQSLLKTLDWRVNPVVPSGPIIDSLINYLPSNTESQIAIYIYDCSKYLAELSVSVPALCLVHKPSIIAFSSILYALDTLGTKYLSCKRRNEYEEVLATISSSQLKSENESVRSARKIIEVICPNLSELFSLPSLSTPESPKSVQHSMSM